MKSKTSFFNKTVFKKNMTRFLPVTLLYTVCLLVGLALMYTQSVNYYSNYSTVNFWFAHYMCQCLQYMGIVNMVFGPLAAMLLFGDLFNGRMCNALHAMPVRRETYFLTNVVSGLVFSLVPTAVMALMSIPLLNNTCVVNAWQIGILWFVGTNLEFICFFGIAVFCVFCTGNRLAMALVYAAINGGAFIVYYLIETVFDPMLFGVITSDWFAELLTPFSVIAEGSFLEVESYRTLERLFMANPEAMVAHFAVNESYVNLIGLAAVGIVFLAVGLVLYRKRDLECAGDAMAFRVLAPVFQVACAVGASALGIMCIGMFTSTSSYQQNRGLLYALLACGLLVGWFGAKMFLERNTRVFALKNWRGVGILAVMAAAAITLTHFDVFGLEDWVPKAEKVRSVSLYAAGSTVELTEQEDIQRIIKLHELALEDHIKGSGAYPVSYIESREEGLKNVSMPSEGFYYGEGGYDTREEHLYAAHTIIIYTMDSGREVQRNYSIWTSQEEGDIVKEYMSRWEQVWESARMGWYDEFDLEELDEIRIGGEEFPDDLTTKEVAEELLAAIQADCEDRTMTQYSYFHDGCFARYNSEDREFYTKDMVLTIYTGSDYYTTAVDFSIYPDSAHTIKWLEDHDMLIWEPREDNLYY